MPGPVEEHLAALPDGWSAETLPEGGMRLAPPRRTGRQILDEVLTDFIFFAVLMALGLYLPVSSAIRRGDHRLIAGCLLLVAAGIAYFAGILIWQATGTEEWVAVPDSLEVRRSLLGVRWRRRHQGARLTIQRIAKAHLAYERLCLEKGGKKTALTHFGQGGEPAEARRIGAALAAVTRWPLQLPDEGG